MSQPCSKKLAENFKLIRETLELSRVELGSILGVSQQQICKYETARNHIQMRHVYILAQKFNLDYELFFEFPPQGPCPYNISKKVLDIPKKIPRYKVLRSIKALVD